MMELWIYVESRVGNMEVYSRRDRSATKHEKSSLICTVSISYTFFNANKLFLWFKTNALSPINPVLDMFCLQQNKLFSSSSLSGKLQGCTKMEFLLAYEAAVQAQWHLQGKHGIKIPKRLISCIITLISLFKALNRNWNYMPKFHFFGKW